VEVEDAGTLAETVGVNFPGVAVGVKAPALALACDGVGAEDRERVCVREPVTLVVEEGVARPVAVPLPASAAVAVAGAMEKVWLGLTVALLARVNEAARQGVGVRETVCVGDAEEDRLGEDVEEGEAVLINDALPALPLEAL